MRSISFFLILIFLSFFTVNDIYSQGKVEVIVENFKYDDGNLLITIYRDAKGFPDNPKDRDVAIIDKVEMVDGKIHWTSPELPYGVYAISLLDDKNKNFEMDYSWGFPQEGFGFSNNAKPRLWKPPTFDDAKFVLNKPVKTLNVRLQFL